MTIKTTNHDLEATNYKRVYFRIRSTYTRIREALILE